MDNHSNTSIPPIDPPITEKSFSIPKLSINNFCAFTISPIVTTGKSKPYSLPVFGFISLGPVEPMHPPMTLGHITKYLFVSIDFSGPINKDHQPSFLVIGCSLATYWSPVNA